MMRKYFFTLVFILTCQYILADGATDLAIERYRLCDEHYYSLVKLKIKRPEPIPFSINAQGGKVEFSPGNLQYQASTHTFRFATRQWEYVGDGVNTSGVKWDSMGLDGNAHSVNSNNNHVSKKYGGWIDLFGWGTSGFVRSHLDNKDPYVSNIYPYSISKRTINATNNYYGYGPSTGISGVYQHIDISDHVSRNYDWGQYNHIYSKWIGYDTTRAVPTGRDSIVYDSIYYHERIWRTLTSAEWDYLFKRRIEHRRQPSWALAKVDNKYEGILIFPDDFELLEAKRVGFAYNDNINYGNNTYAAMSLENFQALEKMGVVFLPKYAHYWSATSNGTQYAKALNSPHLTNVLVDDPRYTRNQVRLVKDIIDDEFDFKPADAQLTAEYPEDSRTFSFRANVDWKAESTVPWLSVSTPYGSKGEQTLTIHFSSNYEEERIGAIVVTGRNKQFLITVQQIEFDIFSVMDDYSFYAGCRYLDLNKNGRLSIPEGRKADFLEISSSTASVKGIEYLENLREVDCRSKKLTSLDLTKNKKLQEIRCNSNTALTSLNLSGTEVKEIECRFNHNLTLLDLSECTKLKRVDCNRNNALTTLKANGCIALETLNCDENQLTSLEVTGCTSLETLNCYDNKLSSLSVIGCTALKELNCSKNEIDFLDVSGCTSLESLDAGSYEQDAYMMTTLNASGCTSLKNPGWIVNIINVNLSGCTALTRIGQGIGGLINLNVSGCTALTELTVNFCRNFSSLNASGCTALTKIESVGGILSDVNLSGCTALTYIEFYGNKLTNLQIGHCTALKTLSCWGNELTTLDVSTCTALETLNCWGNYLTSLIVSPSLRSLDCHYNYLVSLDVSTCTALTKLDCTGNDPLTTLYLKSGQSIANLSKPDDTQIVYK